MKRILFTLIFLSLASIASAQTLPVIFQWDASATPSTTTNPIKYKLCLSSIAPATWPVGGFPSDRICADTLTALEWKFDMAVGIKYVFATARNFGLTVDGVIDPTKEQESGPSNVLKIEVFAPPGRPDKVRIKSVTQAMGTTSGATLGVNSPFKF